MLWNENEMKMSHLKSFKNDSSDLTKTKLGSKWLDRKRMMPNWLPELILVKLSVIIFYPIQCLLWFLHFFMKMIYTHEFTRSHCMTGDLWTLTINIRNSWTIGKSSVAGEPKSWTKVTDFWWTCPSCLIKFSNAKIINDYPSI